MKKIIIFIVSLFMVVGCSCSNDLAADAVEKYLNDYKGLSDSVLTGIDKLVENEDLNDKQEDTYKEILKKQYRNLSYTIENESYDGDNANVTVKITVYDLHKIEKETQEYLNTHEEEFLTNGVYDAEKYLDYKLEKMKETEDTTSYNIIIRTIKVDGKWQVEQPDEETLEKIHGIYNYDR